MEDNYSVQDFQKDEKGAIVLMTEEKRATVVAVSDGSSVEGSLEIFENKEAQLAKNELEEAIAEEKFKICTTNDWLRPSFRKINLFGPLRLSSKKSRLGLCKLSIY